MSAQGHGITAAFQGAAGSFSHAAALALFGPGIQLVPCASFEDLFQTVSDGSATHGMVPIENSLAGSVHRNYDLLGEHDLQIVGETLVRVRLCLIARPGISIADLRRVTSHPVALAQCRKLFASNPQLAQVPAFDTAGGVRDVLGRDTIDEGAVGSALAAQLYGGVVLRENVEDHEENYTRFLAVTKSGSASVTGPKVSLVFSLPNKPGALHKALGVFANGGLDLTKLESRPILGRPWEYLFYLDCIANDRAAVDGALTALSRIASTIRVLGRYTPAELQ